MGPSSVRSLVLRYVLAATSLLAAAAAAGACSGKSSSGSPSGASDAGDDGADVTLSLPEAGPDVSILVYDAAGLACPALPMTMPGATCDTCIESSCDMAWCACAADMDTEAGMSGCPGYLACAASCVADGGDASACESKACASAPFASGDVQKGQALLSCIASSCASQCPGFVAPYF